MNLILLMDNDTIDEAESLAPHKNMFDINEHRGLSKCASIPSPVVSTISNYMHYDISNREINPIKQNFLEQLAFN